MQRIVTFKIDHRILELLDRYARMHNMTRSEAIREAIVLLLQAEGYDIPRTSDVPYPDRPFIEVEV